MIRSLKSVVLICFLLSGVSSLIYEVVWTRLFVLVFGTTMFAVSSVLVAFMAGLALGSWWLGRFADRISRPVFLYGLLEVGIGLYALFIPAMTDGLIPLSQWLWRQWQPSFYAFSLIRFLLAFAILLLPTTLMGGTLPVLSKFYAERKERVGFRIGLLYGLNTLGAVIGAVAAGFVLLPEVGMRSTTQAAVTINLLVGFFAMAIGRSEPARVTVVEVEPVATVKVVPVSASSNPHALSRSLLLAVLIAFALSGFVGMIYEVAWTRLLALILGSSTSAFTIMLATFLVGLALGSSLMARWVDRLRHPLLGLARVEIGAGLAALVGEHFFHQLPEWFLWLFGRFAESPHLLLASQFLLAFLVMFLPTLLLGTVFPLVVRIYAGDLARVGRRVGTAYAMNTLGTILGAFSAGFILLPALGIQRSVTLGLVMNLLVGLALVLVGNPQEKLLFRFITAVGVVLLIPLAIYAAPTWDPLVMSSGVYKDAPLYLRLYRSPKDVFSRIKSQYQPLFYKEGVTATVTVVERPSLEDFHHLTLSIDGKVDASTAADMPTQILSAHLPLLVARDAKKVMVIGWASGMTVGSVAQHPVEEIMAVEIEPAVISASAFFNSYNHQPLKDPRVKVVINDARNHLLISNERFDVIISEPSNPWMSGPSKLFTREFFRLGRGHLRQGGIFAQWLQIYGMSTEDLKTLVRTFHSVFPYVLVFQTAEGDLILLGSDEELKLDYRQMEQRMALPAVTEDLSRLGVRTAADLLAKFRLGSKEVDSYTGSGLLNTDDNAVIEFAAPKSIYTETTEANLSEINRASKGIAAYLVHLGDSQTEQARDYLKLARKYLTVEGDSNFLIKRLEEAEQLAQESLKLQATAEAHWIIGEARLQRGLQDEAVREWEAALNTNPSDYASLMSLSLFYHNQQDYPTAERYLQELLQRDGNDPLAHYYLGINQYVQGKFESAIAQLKTALEIGMPEFRGGEIIGPVSRASESWPLFLMEDFGPSQLAHYYLSLASSKLALEGQAVGHMKEFLHELQVWRAALEVNPTALSTFNPVAATNLKLLQLLRARSESISYTEEEAKLVDLIARYVIAPVTHFYQGTAYYFLGYYDEAAAELSESLRMLEENHWDSPLAHYYLGLTYRKLNQYGPASAHLEHFVKNGGGRFKVSERIADARRNLAEIQATAKRNVGGDKRGEHE